MNRQRCGLTDSMRCKVNAEYSSIKAFAISMLRRFRFRVTDDLIQDCFLSVLQGIASQGDVRWRVIDLSRERIRKHSHPKTRSIAFGDDVISSQDLDFSPILDLLAGLRLIVMLACGIGCESHTFREIARVTGMPVSSVIRNYRRAHDFLSMIDDA